MSNVVALPVPKIARRSKKGKDFVREFQKWNAASDAKKIQIVMDQASWITDGILVIPEPDGENIFDAITPCGKRLGACYKADLDAMAAWHDALAAALRWLAKRTLQGAELPVAMTDETGDPDSPYSTLRPGGTPLTKSQKRNAELCAKGGVPQ